MRLTPRSWNGSRRTWTALLLVLSIGLLAAGAILQGCAAGKYDAMKLGRDAARQFPHNPAAHGRMDLPPGGAPSRHEELWVIERAAAPGAAAPAPDPQLPGTGALMTRRPGTQEQMPVPLAHTDVKASIAGHVASVDVVQQYTNPFDVKIEALYVFPLPHNAAVSEFVMTIGERRIRGVIREREEARLIYEDARRQGYVASLLTQERPNIFTQAVANIEPGERIDVEIRYFHTLAYSDGWFEFVFPMVVGPRFNPPGSTDGVGAVARGARGASGQPTEVSYLRPDQRSGHDIDLTVTIDAGMRVEDMECRNHQVTARRLPGDRGAVVTLAEGDRIPNKDFVLRYRLAGATVMSSVMAHRDARGGFFTMLIVPPASMHDLPRQPLELVFTIDTSGSMQGRPLEQCKAAVRHALRGLDARDTFQVVRFGNRAERLASAPLPATPENVAAALAYVDRLQAGGGTMLVDGLRASLEFPHDEGRLRFVTFMTDGFIGNEAQALGLLRSSLGPARVFSFGVGSSPNRFLMDAMARAGNGAVSYLALGDPAEQVMEQFMTRISRPAMTDLALDFGGLKVSEVYPQRLPDLFVGRPLVVTGRFGPAGGGRAVVKLAGTVAGQRQTIDVPVDLSADASDDRAPAASARAALPAIWARTRIADLAERVAWQPDLDAATQIKSIALEYGLMSPFTAFVAVDASRRTAGSHGVSVMTPVPVPDGVAYETTVQEKAPAPQPGDR